MIKKIMILILFLGNIEYLKRNDYGQDNKQ